MYVELTTVYYDEAPYVLIGVGCGIIVIGMLGCCCTYKGTAIPLYGVSMPDLVISSGSLSFQPEKSKNLLDL